MFDVFLGVMTPPILGVAFWWIAYVVVDFMTMLVLFFVEIFRD